MDINASFDEIYKTSMDCLRRIGAHPSVPKDRKWALKSSIMYSPFLTFGVHSTYNMVFVNIKENNFPAACSNGIFMVILIVVTFSYCVLLWYQNDLKSIIQFQQEYFDSSREFIEEEQETVRKYVKKGQWISNLWFKSCFITASLFPIKSFLDSVYSAYIGEFQLYSFTENYYPLGIDKIKSRLDVYLMIYSTFIYYAFYSGSMYAGFAPIGPVFLMNACGQMEIVTMRVTRLFDGREFNKKESLKELRDIIQFLQKIYSFVDTVNAIFQVLYEICLKASVVMIPISLFLILENARERQLSLDYIMFSYLAFLLSFVPCFYSDKLKEKGEELQFAIYACGWEKFYDKNTRATLYIMSMRASRPIAIKTVFRVVCLETFAEFCKQAYVIFNMMYAVLE